MCQKSRAILAHKTSPVKAAQGKRDAHQFVQFEHFLLDHVLHTAWCSHNHIKPPSQGILLRPVGAPTVNAGALEIERFCNQIKVRKDLQLPTTCSSNPLPCEKKGTASGGVLIVLESWSLGYQMRTKELT